MARGEHTARILLVDDKPERLLSYEAILDGLGYELVRALSGAEALHRLMEAEFAAILLDVNMPGMDGFETAGLIRDHPRFQHTPIIFVTGVHVTDFDRLEGYRMGAVDYVYIPVVPEILRGKVQVLAQLYLQRQELTTLNRRLADTNAELAAAHRALQDENTRELKRLNGNLEKANLDLASANRRLKEEITQRQKAQQQLQSEAKRKDEFLAILAHELRNPMAAIHTGVQVMRQGTAGSDEREWVQGMLERQVKHLISLVDDLLDVSRITHGRIELHRDVVELAELARYAVESVTPLADEKELTLALDLTDGLHVDGDPVRLAQILDNLLSNAIKHTPQGGRIELRIAEEASRTDASRWATLYVRDTGVGIEPNVIDSVFELFVQADGPPGGSASGLGIGLALVRGLVELHGGSVTATSAGKDCGSEFKVRLPLAAPSTPVEPVSMDGAAAQSMATGLHLLIIDDNVDSSQGLAICLERAGHAVEMAHDSQRGIDAALARVPDAVLLDIGLPDMDGYQVAMRLRHHDALRCVPLIAITGFGAEHDRHRAMAAGFNGYLVKPVDLTELDAMLASQVVATAN